MSDTIKAALVGALIGTIWALVYIFRTGGF
jgi:hypothetical protein